MDYKEIMEKINSSNKITVEKTKDIPHGRSLLLNNSFFAIVAISLFFIAMETKMGNMSFRVKTKMI